MAFKTTEWAFSNEVEKEYIAPEKGLRYLHIDDAAYGDDTHQYDVFVTDLTNDAEFRLRYWVDAVDKTTQQFKPSYKDRAMLIQLGRALAGPDTQIGIPFPKDIVGGVIKCDLDLVPNKDGTRTYPKALGFYPVEKDIFDGFSDIDQYYIPEEGTEVESDAAGDE